MGPAAGAFLFVGFYFFIPSLATGAVSTNASIFRMDFIVTVVLVVLLGEPLTPGKLAGFALALLATWLLLAPASAQANIADDNCLEQTRRRSLIQVVIATLAFGASHFFHTVGLRHGALPETMAAAQGALFMPLATVVVFVTDRSLRPPRITFGYGSATAVMLFGATILLLRGVAEARRAWWWPIAQSFMLGAPCSASCAGRAGFDAWHSRRIRMGFRCAFKLECPFLPTMRWLCRAMLSGFATSTIGLGISRRRGQKQGIALAAFTPSASQSRASSRGSV